MENFHLPVMPDEVIGYFKPLLANDAVFVDCTLGGGGHAAAICRKLGPTGRLIGIEQDAAALKRAQEYLQEYPVTFVHENFRHLENIFNDLSVDGVDGFLFDLGISSFQIETPERGFSFRAVDAPLDSRMDLRNPTTAADLVNRMSEEDLRIIFLESGYGKWARRLARAITAQRQLSQIITTSQFADLIAATIPIAAHSKIHPATKAFQALRITVNDEVAALSEALVVAVHRSNITARVVVISYHSLEDREAKQTFKYLSGKPLPTFHSLERELPPPPRLVSVLTKKPLTPSAEEIQRNPRSRSAKLRVAERVAI